MNKKILLTGANGLLGQKLVELLSDNQDNELIALARGKNRNLNTKGYTYVDIDLTDFDALAFTLKNHRPTHIIHTAAVTNVDYCESNTSECDVINVDLTEQIFSYCEKNGVHLNLLSTDFIFDGTKGDLYTEEDNPNPLSYYGESKWKAEQILLNSEYKNWCISRTILVYGLANEMSRSNIALWAVDVLKSGKDLKIVNDQFRSPTLAEDLAQGCYLLTNNNETGIFNVAGPDYISIYDLVLKVAEVFDLSTKSLTSSTSEELGQPANRPPKTGLDIRKIKEAVVYTPHSLEEGLNLLREQLAKK